MARCPVCEKRVWFWQNKVFTLSQPYIEGFSPVKMKVGWFHHECYQSEVQSYWDNAYDYISASGTNLHHSFDKPAMEK